MPLHSKIDRANNLIYVAMKNGGVQIMRLKDPDTPQMLSKISKVQLHGMDAIALTLKGKYLYVALGDIFAHRLAKAGLAVIDISDPAKPLVRSFWQSLENTGGASCVTINDGYLYLGAMAGGLYIFKIDDESPPNQLLLFQLDPKYPVAKPNRVNHPNVRDIAAYGNLLFVCYDAGGLRVIDVSSKIQPKEIARYINTDLLGQQQAYNDIALSPPYAYLSCDYAGVETVDISDLRAIKRVSWWDPWRKESGRNFWFGSHGHANQIQLDTENKKLFVSAGDSELVILNVKDPKDIRIDRQYGGIKDNLGAWGVTADSGIAYVSYIRAFIPFRSNFSGIKAIDCRSKF